MIRKRRYNIEMKRVVFFAVGVVSGLMLSSCGTANFKFPNPLSKPKPAVLEPTAQATQPLKKDTFVNPFPEGTYEHFKAEPDYKKTYGVYKNESLLAQTSSANSSLNIDISDQRAQLINKDAGLVAMDYPIATGKSGHETPTGEFTILEKIKDKRSNLYGKMLDASGNVVNGDATNGKTPVPPGGKFLGAKMPYWMRFTWTGIGHHIGRVPRYPASHGCVRGYSPVMPTIFSKTKVGTPVLIQE